MYASSASSVTSTPPSQCPCSITALISERFPFITSIFTSDKRLCTKSILKRLTPTPTRSSVIGMPFFCAVRAAMRIASKRSADGVPIFKFNPSHMPVTSSISCGAIAIIGRAPHASSIFATSFIVTMLVMLWMRGLFVLRFSMYLSISAPFTQHASPQLPLLQFSIYVVPSNVRPCACIQVCRHMNFIVLLCSLKRADTPKRHIRSKSFFLRYYPTLALSKSGYGSRRCQSTLSRLNASSPVFYLFSILLYYNPYA